MRADRSLPGPKATARDWFNPANLLTVARLLLAPVAAYATYRGSAMAVLFLLAAAALTDMADGRLARRLGIVTRLGVMLDPLADKAFVGSTLAGGLLSGRLPALPPWLVWSYLGKELLQIVGALFFFRRLAEPIKSNFWGKSATVVTFGGLAALWGGHSFGRWLVLAGLLTGLAAVLTYLRAALSGRQRESRDIL